MKAILLSGVAMIANMSDVCETVQIKGANGDPIRVNKSDFDNDQAGDKTMTLFKKDAEGEQTAPPIPAPSGFPEGVAPTAAPSAPNFNNADAPNAQGAAPLVIDEAKNAAAPSVPSPNQYFVNKEGRKFFVVDGQGAKVERDGLDAAGYKSDSDAWAAIMALPR